MADVVTLNLETGDLETRPQTAEEIAAGEASLEQSTDQAWDALYAERSLRLSGTDWLVEPFPADLPDNVQAEARQYEVEWQAYRQALRDLPESTVDPFVPPWPEPPPAPLLALTPQPEALEARRRKRGRP